MMPPNIQNWIEGASRVRMRRDIEQAKADALQQPIHERAAWLHAKKGEADFRHVERMDRFAKAWPAALASFEEEWCHKMVLEIDRS
jgi:hypothetical protein